MNQYFEDYPSISKGLNKLKIITPTDFQQLLLQQTKDMESLIITAPETSGKTVGLLLLSLRKFIN
jgi:hypothetical protein